MRYDLRGLLRSGKKINCEITISTLKQKVIGVNNPNHKRSTEFVCASLYDFLGEELFCHLSCLVKLN